MKGRGLLLIALLMTVPVVRAGTEEPPPEEAAPPGVLVDDPGAAWLRYLRLGGYAHLQAAAVRGEAGGREFWYGRAIDVRRARLVLEADVSDLLRVRAQANVLDDDGGRNGGVEFDYFGLFLAWAKLDLRRLAGPSGFDALSIAYGKRKLGELNEEVDTSSNAIRTVERSSFAAQVSPFRAATGATGVWLKADRGGNEFSLGVYTTDSSPEWGDWQDGTLLVGAWRHDFAERLGVGEALVSLGGGVQDVADRDERYASWEWIVTPWLRWRDGPAELRVSAGFGENEGSSATTGGDFYGLTVMPAYELVEDRLRAVGRYQVMASEAPQGVGLASRYARQAGLPANEGIPGLARGRGDLLQSVYAGLAWTVRPERVSVLGGVEWERLESRDVEVYSGVTGWFATRVRF